MTLPSYTSRLPRLAAARARLRGDQRGWTLVELLVASTVGLVVMSAALDVYAESARSQSRTANRVAALRQSQVGLERMTREIRQASSYTISGASEVIDVETQVRPAGGGAAIPRHVRYDCSGTACVRFEGPPNQPAPTTGGVTVVTGVQSALISVSSSRFIGVRLDVTVPGESGSFRLRDGATMRNVL